MSHRVIGEIQRLDNRPMGSARIVQSHCLQPAMQAGLCSRIIELCRDRRAILLTQFRSYNNTYVIYSSDNLRLDAQSPRVSRRAAYRPNRHDRLLIIN